MVILEVNREILRTKGLRLIGSLLAVGAAGEPTINGDPGAPAVHGRPGYTSRAQGLGLPALTCLY